MGKSNGKSIREGGGWGNLKKIFTEEGRLEIRERLERGAEIKRDQGIQSNWSRIDKSRYCRDYKEWKLKAGRERYFGDRRVSSET